VDDSAKDGVLFVKVRSSAVADEELAAVGVSSRVGHTENTLVRVGVPNLLISKLLSVDGHATGAVAHGGVAALHHEAFNDTVELVSLVVLALTSVLTRAKASEVFTGLGHVSKELEDHTLLEVVLVSLLANGHVEVHLGVLGVEGRQAVVVFVNLCRFFLVVDALGEELLHSSLLAGSL
jgi:hypothetical protein